MLGSLQAGQAQGYKQLGEIADKALADFNDRETQRMQLWANLPENEKAQFLATEYNTYIDALNARNRATGNRMTPQQIKDTADSYFARYMMGMPGAQPAPQGGGGPVATIPGGVVSGTTPNTMTGFNEEPQDWSIKAIGPGDLVQKSDPGGQKPDYITAVFSKMDKPDSITQEEADAMWDFLVANPTAIPGFEWKAKNPAAGQAKGAVLTAIKNLTQSPAFKASQAEYMARQNAIPPLTIQRGAGPTGESAPLPPPLPSGLNEDQKKAIWNYLLQNKEVKTPATLEQAKTILAAIQGQLPNKAIGDAVSEPTLALIGEGGEREFVVPESKAPLWAQLLLQNPQNPPNPAMLPRMDGGIPAASGGMDSQDPAATPRISEQDAAMFFSQPGSGPQYVPASPQTQALAGPGAPAPAPASPDPAATPPADFSLQGFGEYLGIKIPQITPQTNKTLAGAVKKLAMSAREAALDKNPTLGAAIDRNPELGDQVDKLGEKVHAQGMKELGAALKLTPETSRYTKEMGADFARWYRNAEPEEIALFLGDKNAAAYRDKKFDRELQYEELALKWKYYELQERASQGDEVATWLKFAYDTSAKYLELNKTVIEKKGIERARADDSQLNEAVKVFQFITGGQIDDVQKVGFLKKFLKTTPLSSAETTAIGNRLLSPIGGPQAPAEEQGSYEPSAMYLDFKRRIGR